MPISPYFYMYNSNITGYGYNPYYNNYIQQNQQQIMQQPQQVYRPQMQQGLQGKAVDNIEVVKATDIPFDFSISYFPLTDGSAIVTKQIQQDGTSKIIIYRPYEEKKEEEPKYITESDLNTRISDINNKINSFNVEDIIDIKEELEKLKKQFNDLSKKKEK